MTPETLLTFDGIEQPIAEWALDYGIPARLIIQRLKRGMSVEKAITKLMPVKASKRRIGGKPPSKQARRYTHNGETLTVKEWAQRVGVSPYTIYMRLRIGYPIEVALSETPLPQPARSPRLYTYNGETLTAEEWAQRLGIGVHALMFRMRAGKPLEVVFAPGKLKPEGIGLTFNGQTLSGMEWCRRTGISRSTLANRLNKLGWTVERALTAPVRPKRRPGVSSDLEASKGTGAGSNPQAISNITFEEKPE